MNWYKISSKNIKLDKQLRNLAVEVASEMIKLYGKQFGNIEVGNDIITNPYSGTKQKLFIVALDRSSEIIAKYAPSTLILNVYPNSLSTKIKDKKMILEHFRQAIYHELVHVIDPSMMFIRQDNNFANECDYFCLPYEFNAYSAQISENILSYSKIDKYVLGDIKQWLKFNNGYPDILKSYDNIINCWQQHDKIKGTRFIKMFKQRLYQSLFFKPIKEDK